MLCRLVVVVIRDGFELAQERVKPGVGVSAWGKILLNVFVILCLVDLVLTSLAGFLFCFASSADVWAA